MTDNKNDNLLKIIVEEYIDSVSPVGSNLMVEKYFPELSSATIRNYMVELEERGLIYQPHTSAGRVPTLAGYQYYVEKFVSDGDITAKNKKIFDSLSKKIKLDSESIKLLAKLLAELSEEAVLIGFAPTDVYYTGISNLFRQPEFIEHQVAYSMSEIIDHLDEAMAKIFHQIDNNVKILMGDDNPFGNGSSVILVKYKAGKNYGLVGIFGPNRMDYQENIGLIKYAQKLLENL